MCGRITFYISGVKVGLVETPEREVFLSFYVTLWEGKVQVAIRVCQKYFSVPNLGVPVNGWLKVAIQAEVMVGGGHSW